MLERPFPYEAQGVRLTEMLAEMTTRTGLPVLPGEGLSGNADIANADGSVRDLLDQLVRDGVAIWWFDGVAVHVEPASAMTSRLLPLHGVSPRKLRAQMRAVGLEERDGTLLAEGDSELIRVVAPAGYVSAVEQIVAALADKAGPAQSASPPVIIRGPGRMRLPPITRERVQPAATAASAVPPRN